VHCLEQLENHAEALAAGERQQALFGEGFDSDDEEEATSAIGAGPPAAKSAQGRIMCALLSQQHLDIGPAFQRATLSFSDAHKEMYS
jgi:hypothetical protein